MTTQKRKSAEAISWVSCAILFVRFFFFLFLNKTRRQATYVNKTGNRYILSIICRGLFYNSVMPTWNKSKRMHTYTQFEKAGKILKKVTVTEKFYEFYEFLFS